MNRAAKYIIWDDGITECAIIFNNHLKHVDMVFKLMVEPISAGFVLINDSKVVAYGESVSLNIRSRAEDSEIIQRILFPED
jgi:hypothetical protein